MTYIGQSQLNTQLEDDSNFVVGDKVSFKSCGKSIYNVIGIDGDRLILDVIGSDNTWRPQAKWFKKEN